MKSKYIFGGAIIVIFLGLMVYLFSQSNIQYQNDFTKVMAKDKVVKAAVSWVKEKSYQIDKADNTFSFYLEDAHGKVMKVVYDGTIPNKFESAQSVVVTGKYTNGYFHATDILTKCPSKYEGENIKASKI